MMLQIGCVNVVREVLQAASQAIYKAQQEIYYAPPQHCAYKATILKDKFSTTCDAFFRVIQFIEGSFNLLDRKI